MASAAGERSALELRAAGASDLGLRRPHNEDVVLVRDDLMLYVVADGAGGHNAGDIAADLAVNSIASFFAETAKERLGQPEFDRFGLSTGARRLSAAVQKANHEVVMMSRSSRQHKGMGTTVVAAAFSPGSGLLHVAHVGDSRCYRLRAGHLEQLTQDHSLLTEVLEQRPDMDDAALVRLPQNVVTRALGMEESLRVSVHSYSVVEGDRYLLCSDGLSGVISASTIAECLTTLGAPDAAVSRLIRLANEAGGPDNIAALVINCRGGHEHALPASASVEPGARKSGAYDSDPELLILGIEDMDAGDRSSLAGGDLLKALDEILGKRTR